MLLFGIVLRCRGEAELSSSGSLKTVGDITLSMIVCTSKCKVDSIVDYLLSYGYFTFGTLNEFHPETIALRRIGACLTSATEFAVKYSWTSRSKPTWNVFNCTSQQTLLQMSNKFPFSWVQLAHPLMSYWVTCLHLKLPAQRHWMRLQQCWRNIMTQSYQSTWQFDF